MPRGSYSSVVMGERRASPRTRVVETGPTCHTRSVGGEGEGLMGCDTVESGRLCGRVRSVVETMM